MALRMVKRKPGSKRLGRPPSVERTPAARMTGRAFVLWQSALGLTDSQAARMLGTSPSTIARYRTQGGSRVLALACAAVKAGIT
jgi:DNA-binding CsgD family transcriptional regulator